MISDKTKSTTRPWRLLLWAALALVLVLGAASLILPAFNHRHDHPHWLRCQSNLRQIGLALMMYSNTHQVYPHSFKELMESEEIDSYVFICPANRTETPATGPTTQATAAAVVDPSGKHCSFTYVVADWPITAVQDDDIIVFESKPDSAERVVNVLFGDAHVEQLFAWPERDLERYHRLTSDYAAGIRPLRLR